MRRGSKIRTAATACAVLLPFALAQAGDPPKIKEGLWEIRGESVENPGAKHTQFKYKLCRDHAYDKAANDQLKDVKGCSTVIKDLGGGKFSSASTCAVAGVTIESSGLSVYKGDTATHAETHAAFTPAFNGKTDETMTQDQQYVGKCPDGMKPGDRLSVNGLLLHPTD